MSFLLVFLASIATMTNGSSQPSTKVVVAGNFSSYYVCSADNSYVGNVSFQIEGIHSSNIKNNSVVISPIGPSKLPNRILQTKDIYTIVLPFHDGIATSANFGKGKVATGLVYFDNIKGFKKGDGPRIITFSYYDKDAVTSGTCALRFSSILGLNK